MSNKVSVFLFRAAMVIILVMLLLLSVVYPAQCIIGIIICIVLIIKAPAFIKKRPIEALLSVKADYSPAHEQYVLLKCPNCGKWTACPDLRAAIPGVNFSTAEEALEKIGAEKLEEVDAEFDPDSEIEEAAYCPSCRYFFDPT